MLLNPFKSSLNNSIRLIIYKIIEILIKFKTIQIIMLSIAKKIHHTKIANINQIIYGSLLS